MQKFLAVALATSLMLNAAYAAETVTSAVPGPLAPGKPAGIKQADIWDLKSLAVITGGAVLVIGFALLVKEGSVTTTDIPAGIGNASVFAATTTS